MAADDERPTTRERLVEATVELLRTKGPTASGTKEILERARAPRGSFYFHFPDGKDQLVAEALARAAGRTGAAMTAAMEDRSRDLPQRVEALVLDVAADLVAGDYQLGCAVAATALEASATSPPLRTATGTAFASWTAVLTEHLHGAGVARDQAAALADSIVAGLEGATIMARARRDTAPLEHVAALLAAAVATALERPE